MLVKIGDCWVDPQEIALIRGDEPVPDYQPNAGSQMLIQLRRGAGIWITATMDEAEAALIDAGVIENPYPEAPTLTDGEAEALQELFDNDYEWLARDSDGKLFAYAQKPTRSVYWDVEADTHRPRRVEAPFDFITADDAEPWSIPYLLLDA